jgi:Protein of unknown function (DUF1549)/Protein of unknown function (DUF1553)/Planctomycete cytochrome C
MRFLSAKDSACLRPRHLLPHPAMTLRRHRLTTLCVAAALLFGPFFAIAEENDQSAEGVVYFEKQIRPLLVRHCYQCHSEKSEKREGELLLDSQQGWLRGGDTGAAVVAGDVEASLLIQAVRYSDTALQMPPIKPLEAQDVAKLEHWIRMGAPAPLQSTFRSSDDPSDPVAGKQHWAFQPLSNVRPPEVASEWPQSEIDAFVASRLEQAGLQPAADSDASVLARRLYVQVTGLPPSPSELQEFLADTQPLAYERLVDRLLSSARFGERWGRHWLDLARYADSNGLDENFLFREAWRYRNWVIDAISTDMPFDRFVLMQLAGDLLPHASIEERDQQRIAAGFLLIGPKVLLGNIDANQRMEIADEQIDSIGRALLGQTLGCARCHNHKFDPVPTADYYALAGIFSSTQVMERRWMLGEQRVMEQLVGLGPQGDESDEAYEKYWRERPNLTEQKKQAEAALELLKKNDATALAEKLEKQPDSFADAARDGSRSIEERTKAQQSLVEQLANALKLTPPIPPRAMIPTDVAQPADEHVRLAGQFDRIGEKVPRGFLTVLRDHAETFIPTKESGRVALGQWLTDRHERSGHLAARVLANRIWYHLIGRGLVRTVDNFGRTGESPSHPELLDHLASELIESNWSIKALVRKIVVSRTFRLSSQQIAANHEQDPENRLLWRAHRRRLDPESFRDAMLSAADKLDLSRMDSTVSYLGDQATAVGANPVRRRTDFPCRSVYLPVIRNDLPELFEIFDFANPHATTGMRPNTTVPTQGLFMLNDELVMDAAKSTARRIMENSATGDFSQRIMAMYDLILGTRPTEAEVQSMSGYLKTFESQFKSEGKPEAELDAMALACHALFASSRFQFLE